MVLVNHDPGSAWSYRVRTQPTEATFAQNPIRFELANSFAGSYHLQHACIWTPHTICMTLAEQTSSKHSRPLKEAPFASDKHVLWSIAICCRRDVDTLHGLLFRPFSRSVQRAARATLCKVKRHQTMLCYFALSTAGRAANAVLKHDPTCCIVFCMQTAKSVS